MIVGHYKYQLEYNEILQQYKHRAFRNTVLCLACGVTGILCALYVLLVSDSVVLGLFCLLASALGEGFVVIFGARLIKTIKLKSKQLQEIEQYRQNEMYINE